MENASDVFIFYYFLSLSFQFYNRRQGSSDDEADTEKDIEFQGLHPGHRTYLNAWDDYHIPHWINHRLTLSIKLFTLMS